MKPASNKIRFKKLKENPDAIILSLLLVVSNLHLIGAGTIQSTAYIPDATVSGQIRRLITFTFAHVSWYHFLLDASAFIFLYLCFDKTKKKQRTHHMVLCSATSLLFVMLFAPQYKTIGYCGLSGPAHGLMAVLALEMFRSKKDRTLGICIGVAVISKCTIELISGGPVFSFMHGNMVGTPLLISHTGGVVGGVLSFFIIYGVKQNLMKKFTPTTGLCLLFAFVALISFPESAGAGSKKRSALVIGNSSYTASPLKNPENDAREMAKTLNRLGFDVAVKTNATQREMEESIGGFGRTLRNGGVGLFFYAGHAVQVGGINYLIPVNSNIQDETDIRFEAVNAERVLSVMNSARNPLNIVILDACRNNPFNRGYRSSDRGLARMDAPKGTLIAYSTSPGSVASDGDGKNSPYTSLLLQYMLKENLPVEQVFKCVRRAIDVRTYGRQTPWESTSLTGDFYFNPAISLSTSGHVGKRYANTPSQMKAPAFIDFTAPSLPLHEISTSEADVPGMSEHTIPSLPLNDMAVSGESILTIRVVNETGHPLPHISLGGGPVRVNDSINSNNSGSSRTVYSKSVPPGTYQIHAEARYGFHVDDLVTRTPSVPAASPLFTGQTTITVRPKENKDLKVFIRFKHCGFWETRKKEQLIIAFSEH